LYDRYPSEDLFITAYRDHGLAIAKGISVNSCMAELYGKATGCAKGKGGSMHFFGKAEIFMAATALWVHRSAPVPGLAFAEQYRGTDNVVPYFILATALPGRACCTKPSTWP
jgi:pyruvate dehydrogenase E1 component alpha subunit